MDENKRDVLSVLLENKTRRTRFGIAAIVLALIVGAVFFKGYTSAGDKYKDRIQELEEEVQRLSDPAAKYETATKEISIAFIKSEIQDIGELATVEYFYTNAGKFEDPATLFGKEIPFAFTTKSFIAKWDGVIKAGVNVDEVTVEINDAEKAIIVHIPKAELLSHEIDSESIETLDEKNGLFNPVKVEDVREFDAMNKEDMEERAVEQGILEQASENAKRVIYKILDTDLVEELEYTIEVEDAK